MSKSNPYVLLHDGEAKRLNLWRSTKSVKFWILTLFFLGGFLYFIDLKEIISIQKIPFKAIKLQVLEEPVIQDRLKGYLVNTPGCRIPEMHPFDPSVKKFVFPPPPLSCTKDQLPSIFYNNLTTLIMNDTSLLFYNISNSNESSCCYEQFIRREPKDSEEDSRVVYSGICTKIIARETHIESEFIKVTCKDFNGKTLYTDLFSFVPVKTNPPNTSRLKPNVLVIGLDAVSRVNLNRQMPKTYEYLSRDLNAIELLGYNKVGDNTFPNLVAVFSGSFEEELQVTCWPKSSTHFDDCPFIWKEFQKNGYVTAIGEDCSPIATFNYLKHGFKKQPSDYYYTSFDMEMLRNIGRDKDFNCLQCLGDRESYQVTLNYIKKFTQRMHMEMSAYFAFFWTNSLSHDYLNRPALGDDEFHALFMELKQSGHLENTIMIFMSDHGIRWGDIRQTHQGQMEERLPFVFMVIPDWMGKNFPRAIANLKTNVRRLTTPFDLHETLRAFLDVTRLRFARNIINETARGYSLFNEIPKNRTCQDAEIVSHWCTCQESKEIDVNNKKVISAAHFAVDQINVQLQGYAQCAVLELANIERARIMSYNDEHITNSNAFKDYILVLTTVPGDAKFEVTVRARLQKSSETDLEITGTISRINPYGKQSSCITDFHLKLYCFCKSLIKF
ncbi:uncharacterized protein [Euwallacea similis]|uniref:uncharacterized protein isoform X2 n=1 Tax=Euwallacea similis TaxID=1736056 RepID=UPI00344E95C8